MQQWYSSVIFNHLSIARLENWNQTCSFPHFWETTTVQLFIEQGAEGNTTILNIKMDSVQSLSNTCKNYLLKIYSQHGNFLNAI